MVRSLRVLLESLIDYAGLFPPASLPMSEAVGLYAEHRRGPQAWMLARFICPARRLDEFAGLRDRIAEAQQWPVSMLCSGGEDRSALLAALDADLEAARGFVKRLAGRAGIESIEVRLPAAVVTQGPVEVQGLISAAGDRIAALLPGVRAFYEISYEPAGADGVARALMGLTASNNRQGPGRAAGAKLRTGGTAAAMFPTCGQVAGFISGCLSNRVVMKATAGLHHPIRRLDSSLGIKMHGFVNVFAGAALACAAGLTEAQLTEVLDCEDPDVFQFDGAGLHWRQHGASVEDTQTMRRILGVSYGSCSFTEPVEDLMQLGWLAEK